ncbi:4Fe-4S ferredoxin [Methylobacterium sp. Leaf399]|uniref:4Fe-4S binding protein n=1 Tax=Methylobacterium sp. Leaf399 TaxID=1736364 RepID=UPI0006F31E29|nr:4Fe-4S binding protein [Methylobacterium sp. Leaf399]KQT14647.1 4Fe-4S ferredoxin [Methylobacterium sp. Leaf399]
MSDRVVFACSCEGTVPLDAAAIAPACGGRLETATELCGREIERLVASLESGAEVTVSCSMQAPLFSEHAAEIWAEDRLTCIDIRESAGWSSQGAAAGPKIAALLASAAEVAAAPQILTMESQGVVLVYGRDEVAVEAGRRLADHLDVTVLLSRPGDVAPPRRNDFPVLKGTIAGASGHLGAFSLRIDDYAVPSPASRGSLLFGEARNGATSTCDLVLDLTGGTPLFPAHDLRSGYVRADPRDPTAVEAALFSVSHLVGTFEKSRFIDFHAELCAHSRSRITGCTRCLDVCPTGAIAPAGEHVAIDPHVCAGCGSCASVCPTGAAAYTLPAADALMRRLRTLMRAYHAASGRDGVVLFHDDEHGTPLIQALARYGDGLPANVLPVAVNELTQIGPEAVAALFAYGAVGVRLLVRAKPRHDIETVHRLAALTDTVVRALGYGPAGGGTVVGLIETDDPDALSAALAAMPLGTAAPSPAAFMPVGPKRDVLRFAFRELHVAAPAPVAVVPLAADAPFGGLDIDVEGCTLCLSCVSACPTHALGDSQDRPLLAFDESLCVQCGLCAATCPERVITLKPQIDFEAWAAPRRVVKEEEPFDCVACGKPFGTRSTIERVMAKLKDRHWMFAGSAGEERLRTLMMCDTCRIEVATNTGFDPHTAPERPRPRTSEDYLRERAERGDPLA